MGTTPENSLSNFDLDLLLCPASTSLAESIEIKDHGYQVHHTGTTDYGYQVKNMGNMGTTDYGYQVKNMGNMGTTDYGYQIQNMVNELYLPHEVVKKSDYEALQNAHEEKIKDYEAVKKQYAKVASDYANLHVENRENALAALNTSTINENLELQATVYMAQIKALEEQRERLETNYCAQNSNIAQFKNYVIELQTQNANLKNDVKNEKLNGKDGRKMISTLKNTNQTLTEHLCLFACVIEGRSVLDKEIRRLIKKYCKKIDSGSKKSVEESFENQSIDTGRGSSLASSDAERSFYSPAYSINFSPLSTGTRNQQTKMMRDASSSTMVKTSDIATSPIIFEEAISPPLALKTFDDFTSPLRFADMRTPEAKMKTLDIATSPIQFVDTRIPEAKIKTLDIATSPIKFADTRTSEAKTNTLDIATSPIQFADTRTQVAKAKTLNIATSPIKFADTRTSEAKTNTLDIATSPIQFADRRTRVAKAKTLNIATSPIKFADTRTPEAKTYTLDIATSPVQFDDTRPRVAKAKTLNIATSPIKFADTRTPEAKTYTLGIATSPIQFDDTRPRVAKAKTLNIATSPIKFADTRTPEAKTYTLDIATSPIQIADTRLRVAKAKPLNIATSPIKFADTRTPVTKTKTLAMTSPIDCFAVETPVAKIKTLDITRPIQRAHMRTPVAKTKSLHIANCPNTENLLPINSDASNCNTYHIEDRLSPLSMSKNTNLKTSSLGSTTCHVSKIAEKLEEIVSQHSDQSQEDAENDREIKMILREQSLNLDILSPMSLTPEVDQENEQTQSVSEETIEKTAEQGSITYKQREICKELLQSLHISEDEPSDDEINREDCHFSNLSIENPQQVTSDVVFDLLNNRSAVENGKNDSIKNRNLTAQLEDVSEPSHKPLNKSPAKSKKTHGTSTKYKKLTNLQKIYKANVRKSKIKSQVPPVKNQQVRPRPYSISPIKYHAALLTDNEEKIRKLPELNAKKLLCKKQDVAVGECIESLNCSFKKPQLLPCSPKRSATKSKSNSECGLSHTQTNLSLESGRKKVVCLSKEIQSKSISDLPHTQKNLLPECGSKQRVCMATETQSNRISDIPHTQINLLPESGRKKRLCTSIERHSNSRNELSQIKTKQVPDCGPSLGISTELICESNQTNYSKPTKIRIARVRKSISINTPTLPSNQSDNSNNNERKSFTCDTVSHNNYDDCKSPPSKRNKAINDALDIGKTRLPSFAQQDNKATRTANIDNCKTDTSEFINDCVGNNVTGSRDDQQSGTSLITEKAVTSRPDDGNINSCTKSAPSDQTRHHADYNDMNMFTSQDEHSNTDQQKDKNDEWRQNIMDSMILKYGSNSKPIQKPKYDAVVAKKIETGVCKCVESSKKQDDYAKALNELVNELKTQGSRRIISGLMKYLNDPARKAEFIPEKNVQKGYHFGPTVTETEMALIDVIALLEKSGIALWKPILASCEYTLFTLEKGATPVFPVVESVSHFYANICKFQGNVSGIWMFMLNAMYCLSFKAIPLIKHCLDVVPHVLPYPNTYLEPGYAPMIRCLVFLLHFYNCDDPFKRVLDLRLRLKNKYHYNLQDENETTILFLLKTSIVNLTERQLEIDMLELSLIIVAKRRGTKWCHKNIVQKILLPMIKGEIEVSYRGKRFCLTVIGHIMKPYKNEMTIHCEEVVNLLINMFEESQPHEVKEDIIRGLIHMNMKTISDRINRCLFNWNPSSVSPEFEETLKDYIHSKPMKNWQIVNQNHCTEI